ncbi:hypothetical protein HETIRDRAFT_100850 [Heterobasidion irregulare TC 32-1]|uniref:Uncharacterized protein n=1 Tax=Heterobasidion irregulare (strain TC 32-1) TaxID=747525 RepID=W4KI33_HETIT|nr:uncharacterized protein HETIRDRAFT_100850 [Heterobasidion irregulare TC 32-1]ETW85502.1 hypothetical protein HETIRDRAFT_100850 [Heterobasidion irregulare TC 32-1]
MDVKNAEESYVFRVEDEWSMVEDATEKEKNRQPYLTLNFDLPIYEQHALPPPPFVSRESSREPIDRKPTTHSRRELAYADESMQSIRNPFLDAAPSGDTPRKPMDRNPFEDVARPIIGSVVAHKPRITSHVAANIRLPLQAQVINCSSDPGVTPARDRRVRRVASGNGQGRQIDVEEGGLFFASRVHKFGQPEVKPQKAIHFDEGLISNHLRVAIPRIELSLSEDMGSGRT